MAEFDSESSAFNMAIATLQRMDYILREANIASKEKDAIQWYDSLKGLYRELEAFMSDKTEKGNTTERGRHKEKLKNINKKYIVYHNNLTQYETTIKMYSRFKNYPFIPPNDLLDDLHDFEISLRRVMKKHGLLMPSTEDKRFVV